MFAATDTPWAPWYVAHTDDKKRGRLNIITHLLSQIPYEPLAPPRRQDAEEADRPGVRRPGLPLSRWEMMLSRPSLDVVIHDMPRRPSGVGGGEHRVPRPAVVVMAAVGLQVHGGELADLARVLDPALEPPGLLVDVDVEPVLDQDDPVVDHRLLDRRHLLDELLALLLGTIPHDRLDAARLYQLRWKMTTSPAAGKWAM